MSVLVLFAIFVWPTTYRYDRLRLGGENGAGSVFPVRIHRFTGRPEILSPRAWDDNREALELGWTGNADQELPQDAVSSLQSEVTTSVSNTGQLSGEMFNNTGWTITKIRWDVTVQLRGYPLTRQFDHRVNVLPNSYSALSLFLGRTDRTGQLKYAKCGIFRLHPMAVEVDRHSLRPKRSR